MIALVDLNQLERDAFVAALDGIFEHSPWVAHAAWERRPFTSRQHLLDSLRSVMAEASREQQLQLLCAHPELRGKAALAGPLSDPLTAASRNEQAGAGLNACSPEEYERLLHLNDAYSERFGFPFILAVKGHTRASIIAEMARRVDNEPEQEFDEALQQVGRIAGFRIADRVSQDLGCAIMSMLERLATWSDEPTALTCTYLSPAHRASAAQLLDWMLAIGMQAHIDFLGNVVGRWPGKSPDGKACRTLLTGSHYDTVRNAGKYDGRLGIVLPIAVIEALRNQGRTLPFDVEVIGFADEEGVRFRSTFLGSRALAGNFDPSLLDALDDQTISLRAALHAAGRDVVDIAAIQALARDPQRLLGFIEVHIEQGPVLLERDLALGIVESIAGSARFVIDVHGQAGHAGTTPMNLRRDAAAAAAEMVMAIEQQCSAQTGLVGTVGQLQVPGGSVNVIPAHCRFSIDMRSGDEALLANALAAATHALHEIAARRKVDLRITPTLRAPGVRCAPRLIEAIEQAVARAGLPTLRMTSGAGHDAMALASLTDVGMLFVRCGAGGISHNPAETMTEADAAQAAHVMLDLLTHFPETGSAD